ncbi:MAG: phosphatase PAP2 family protein [Anaerolineaceae bacterium]|nr:phosphatase PAP2 family protein [Anaerolineaceae bacterium]
MDALLQLEIAVNLFLQHLGSWLAIPFSAITALGNEYFYLIAMPAIYWCVDSALGFRLGVMLVFTNVSNGYFKELFHSPRPFWVDSRVKALATETSFGLPSGHSQNAAALWGTLAGHFKKTWLTIVSIVIIFLIGLSRLYLGMHFTRDVISGWLIGALLVGLYFWLEKPIARWIGPKPLSVKILLSFFVSVLFIAGGLLITASAGQWVLPAEWINNSVAALGVAPDPYDIEGYFTISGVWFGFTAGYAWWQNKKGSFKIQGKLGKRLLRFVVGMVGILVLYLGLKLVFPESPQWLGLSLRFVRYGLIGLWVTALAPWLFEKIHLNV